MNKNAVPRAQPAPLLREYYSRVLAYIAPAAAVAAGTYVNHFGYDILWLVPYALLYPHLAYHLSNRFKRDHPQQTTLVQIPQSLLLAPLAGPMSALNQARNESTFASVRL